MDTLLITPLRSTHEPPSSEDSTDYLVEAALGVHFYGTMPIEALSNLGSDLEKSFTMKARASLVRHLIDSTCAWNEGLSSCVFPSWGCRDLRTGMFELGTLERNVVMFCSHLNPETGLLFTTMLHVASLHFEAGISGHGRNHQQYAGVGSCKMDSIGIHRSRSTADSQDKCQH